MSPSFDVQAVPAYSRGSPDRHVNFDDTDIADRNTLGHPEWSSAERLWEAVTACGVL